MKRDVTVVIPSIQPRRALLHRAIASVTAQTEPAAAIAVAIDSQRDGAWTTRNRALATVRTEWTAFLDDDDELLPHHLQTLLDAAEDNPITDVAWGWFTVVGGVDPFPQHRGRQYDPTEPSIVPITYLARTELLHFALDCIGGFQAEAEEVNRGAWDIQDQPMFDTLAANGNLLAVDTITWVWHHHGTNTSGLPHRWPAESKKAVFR